MAAKPSRAWLHVVMLALCHAMSDFYATTFTPLVETFRSMLGLSVVGVSVIGALIGVFGSMIQPVLGIWSDRTDRGKLAAGGLLVSAVFISQIGLAPNVVVLTLLLIGGALGVAAFHPSGAVLAVRDGARRSLAMAFFITGGGLGLALAPWTVTGIVKHLGLPWLRMIALPGVAFAIWLFLASRREPRGAATPMVWSWRPLFARGTGAVWALFGMAVVRSLAVTAFCFYVSVLGATRGWGLERSGGALSAFLAFGVAGSLVGGYVADRMDHRVLMAASCALAAPFFFVFARTSGPWSIPAFAAAGFLFSMANPVNVSLAQELRPRSASMMSGLMMGLAWGIASVLLTVVGALARVIGIAGALQAMAVVGAFGGLFVFFLPRRDLQSVMRNP